MNKEDIKNLIANIPEGLETETFIHGAICWAYSGRCYLSDYMAHRNANLGDCAQSCRWAYNMYIEEANNPGNIMPVEEDNTGTYVLSSGYYDAYYKKALEVRTLVRNEFDKAFKKYDVILTL